MKKTITILLVLTVLMFCVSCARENPLSDGDITEDKIMTDGQNTVGGGEEDKSEATGYTVELFDKRVVVLGAEADGVIQSLGEYTDMYEAPSCIHEGYDRVYIYDGFSVTSSPDGSGAEYIAEFALDSAGCVLSNGITVGSSVDEMISAYGEDYTDSFGLVTYDLNGSVASFVTDGGVILSIVFTYTK